MHTVVLQDQTIPEIATKCLVVCKKWLSISNLWISHVVRCKIKIKSLSFVLTVQNLKYSSFTTINDKKKFLILRRWNQQMLLSNIIHVSCAIETDFPTTIAQICVIRKPQDRTFSNSFLATWSKWRHHLLTTWVMSNIESQNRCLLERAKWPLMARRCVLQSGEQGSAHWRVWVISHWGKQLKVSLPQSCHLLHADNIDMSSSRSTFCCMPDNERGGGRNGN